MATCLGQFSNSSTLIPADARPFDKSTTIDGLPSFENSFTEIQNPKWTEHQVEVKVLEMMLWLMKERLDEITNIERDLKKTKCVR